MKILCSALLFFLCLSSTKALKNFTRIRLHRPQISSKYQMDLYVGSPMQKISVIADTGSTSTHLKCGKCKGCQFETSVLFEPNKSTTNNPILCGNKDKEVKCQNQCSPQKQKDRCFFAQSYGINDQYTIVLIGNFRNDLISFQSTQKEHQSFNATFGCIEQIINYNTSATGLIGLGPRSQNIVTKWFSVEGANRKKQITICLSKKGGYCEFGHNPEKGQKANMRGKFKPNNMYYETNDLQWIKFGDVDIYWPFLSFFEVNNVFFDTGSAINVIPFEKHLVIKFQTVKACLLNKDICLFEGQYNGFSIYLVRNNNDFKPINQVLNDIFPNLQITLNKVNFVSKPQDYMLQIPKKDQSDKTVHMFIQGIISQSPTQRRYLLGATWMKNKKVVFNLEESYYQIYDNYNCSQMSQSQESITSQKPKQQKPKKPQQTKKTIQQIKKKQQSKNTKPKQKISNNKQKQKLQNENPKQNIDFDEFKDIESFIDKIKNDEQFERKSKQFAQKENPISLSQRSLLQHGSYLFLLIFLIVIVFPPLFFQLFRKIKKGCFKPLQNIQNDSSVSQIPNVSTQVRNQDSRTQNSELVIKSTLTEQSNSNSQT